MNSEKAFPNNYQIVDAFLKDGRYNFEKGLFFPSVIEEWKTLKVEPLENTATLWIDPPSDSDWTLDGNAVQ